MPERHIAANLDQRREGGEERGEGVALDHRGSLDGGINVEFGLFKSSCSRHHIARPNEGVVKRRSTLYRNKTNPYNITHVCYLVI